MYFVDRLERCKYSWAHVQHCTVLAVHWVHDTWRSLWWWWRRVTVCSCALQVDTATIKPAEWERLRTGIALKTFTALMKR